MEKRTNLVIRPKPDTSGDTPASQKTITLSKRLFYGICTLALLLLLALVLLLLVPRSNSCFATPAVPGQEPAMAVEENTLDLDQVLYQPEDDVLGANTALFDYFKAQQLSEPVARELTQQAGELGLEMLEKGHTIRMYKPLNQNPKERIFQYELSANKLFLFHLSPIPKVEAKLKKVETHIRAAGGLIKTTLWEAILDYNIHYRLLEQMEAALKWSVDFYHLEPGDKFKVIYEEKRAGNEIIGIGRLLAVYFKANGKDHYAFQITDVAKPGYYDETGRPVQKTFLKSPVKYERITSFYSLERLHPVTGTMQPHFGTDFAAPPNSPIFSVADGIVEKAEHGKYNGNFVKIRHDLTYETQYLHMVRIADDIKPGVSVKQGQVIGYVGQTGLATGPHVCFRFWKAGQQVDPREEPLNKPFFMSLKDQERFIERKNALSQQLREIVYYDGK